MWLVELVRSYCRSTFVADTRATLFHCTLIDIVLIQVMAFRVLDSIKSVSRRAMQGTLPEVEEETQIYVCDINPNMLSVGKKRAVDRGKRL
jgi:ubiE/COQ5 methyltransferase family